MDFTFNLDLIEGYKSKTQITRVLTEDWVSRNMYCPICGKPHLDKYENNHPVGDFFCENCSSDFELKSKESLKLDGTICDGAYETMIKRINSLRNPNFMFLSYKDNVVSNLVLVPNHFFTPDIIIKRKPLSPSARRAGWVGCNIDISGLPQSGIIYVVKDQQEINHQIVLSQYARTKVLKTEKIDSRTWLMDTLLCIEKIPEVEFTLDQIYAFEGELKAKHPENNFIKDKLRQQLQYLRDKGIIEFLGHGHYCKVR